MTLRLSTIEFMTLLRCASLAKLMVDEADLDNDTPSKDISKLWSILCKAAPEFEVSHMFLNEDPTKFKILSGPELDNLNFIMDSYEDNAFWEILEERLVIRDITKENSEKQWTWKPEQEQLEIYQKLKIFYYEEFMENGIQNLRIDPNKNRESPPDWFPFLGKEENEPQTGKIISFPGASAKKPRKKPTEE